ncbi:MAG: hydantoinase/oxoprolinase family protein [Beijerinckiaceae bacterium]|jgi:N-methylhydantoinase A|nr:hydantoinase/oxoprolinase family protein [Beijerinckiaceae bacterium]
MQAKRIRIAVDIGGTFTDLECVDEADGTTQSFKSPTTPDDPSLGLMNAIKGAAARFGFALSDVGLLMHGTTIATNAVLTRNLPDGALITTAGFEDVLEIGRHARKEIYRLKPQPPAVLVPRRRRFGVVERIGPVGEVLTALDAASVEAAIDRVAASGASVCAIALLNGFTNPAHEIAIRDRLLARLPGLAVSCSHEVSPEIREFERTSTTVLNALLIPVVRRYIDALLARIAAEGLTAPLYLVQSNGGATTPRAAGEAPVKLLLSGPSGGVLAAEGVARQLGFPNVVGVDMGGTSYDVAVIREGRRAVVAQGDIDGLPVRVPMVDMRTIGAGGGSIASLDASGRLQVGPRSAGARPGPVCYGRGGTEPTVTDVNLILGRLDPVTFLGGDFALDLDGARAALNTRIAGPLGLDRDRAAAGILAVVVAKLAGAIKLSLFERGLDPRDFALMSFGGAGGLHAVEVAEELGMTTVIFPKDPSTFSAHGILQSDIVHDLARTRVLPLKAGAAPAFAALAGELLAEGEALLAADGLPTEQRRLELAADLRYRGQAFELLVPLDEVPQDDAALARLCERFHAAHRQRFSFDDPGETVELVTLRLAAVGLLGGTASAQAPAAGAPAARRERAVHLGGRWTSAPVYEQAGLGAGARVEGPAIVEQAYTTLIIPAGWRLAVRPSGDLVATRETLP